MPNSPRVRVAALIRWQNRVLLCRQEKPGKEYWLLPGGGVDGGETLHDALLRELGEELGLWDQLVFEGPIAVAESIAPAWTAGERHVVHIVFGADLSDRSLVTRLDYSLVLLTHLSFDAFAAVRYGRKTGEFRLGVEPIDLAGIQLSRAPGIFDAGVAFRVAF